MYHGAYYLAGYAVECAIKACICRRTRRFDFPDKHLAEQAWKHDVDKLMEVAELKRQLEKDFEENSSLETNWGVVKDWSERTRYATDTSEVQAKNLLSACTVRRNGILPWIRKRW